MDFSVLDIFRNLCFWSPLCAWLVAQVTKMLCGLGKTHRVDLGDLVRLGGMPSAHSSMAGGLVTSVGLSVGFGTPLFATTLAFALVVMFDAATVRRAAGVQARLLNEIVQELFSEGRFSEQKLAELLGHTRLEVFMGMVIGILVALIVSSLWMLR